MKTDQALIAAIDEQVVPQGGLAFWWLGQLSYVVKTSDHILYLDPYLSPSPRRNFPPLVAPEMVTHADFVFGTHDHMDHIDHNSLPGILAASPQSKMVCSVVASEVVAGLGIDKRRIIPLDEGMPYDQDGVRITPIAAAHELLDRDPRLGYPYLSFVIEVDGVAIYHAGDTCLYDGYVAKLRPFDLDVMFVPINGRDAVRLANNCIGNMTYQEAVDLVGTLRPRLAVPGHYEMFSGNTIDPYLFTEYINVKFPDVPYWVGEHGEPVLIDRR